MPALIHTVVAEKSHDLRERKADVIVEIECDEDIGILAKFFMQQFCRKLGRRIEYISEESFEMLNSYAWPGNIRELRNVIERAVIITQGNQLQLPDKLENKLEIDFALEQVMEPKTANLQSSLEDVQRQRIIQTLNQTLWRVEGPKGAAAILGINPGTLRSRMKKGGLVRWQPMMKWARGIYPVRRNSQWNARISLTSGR